MFFSDFAAVRGDISYFLSKPYCIKCAPGLIFPYIGIWNKEGNNEGNS
jgi:hypothetical protein